MQLTLTKGRTFALLVTLILPLLAACGSPAGPTGSSAPASTAAPVAVAPSPTTAAAAEPTAAEPTTSEPAATAPAAEATAPAPAETTAAEPAATTDTTGATAGKVLHVQVLTYPDVVDPQKSSFANEIAILSLNYEGLTKLDSSLKAVPAAAEKWEFNKSGDVITFTLRSGLKYSDGSPLTAQNFRYAVERTCDPQTAGEYQSILFEIKGCQEFASVPVTDTVAYDAAKKTLEQDGVLAPDDRTFVLKLTRPAPYYTYIAGLWVMYPAKQELIEKGGEAWWKDPANQIGNGPFKLKQMAEDQLVALDANENYWGGKPKLDGLEFVFQKDTAIALEAYKAGQLDIMTPDPSQLPAIRGDATLSKELLTYAGANSYGWGFNLKKEPFTDKKVREAFAYAIDRKTYCEVIRNGDCVPSLSWIPEGVTGAIKTDAYTFDPAKAKQALAESTYGGPDKLPEIKLSYNSDDPAAQPRIEWIAGQLRDILGINVTLDPTDGKTLTSMRKNPETYPQACVFCTNWFQDYPDPQNWLSVYWTCDSVPAHRVGFCDKKFDELTKQGDVELDDAKRAQFYQQAGQLLIDDLPAPFVYHLADIFLVKPYVTGYKTTAADSNWPGQWGSMNTVDITK